MSEIVLEHVCKSFTTKDGTVEALKDISLTIEQGEIFGVIGMSGAGKSTLVRCMNFLEEPDSGSVLIDGRALDGFSKKELQQEREQIGMIFQHFNLLMQKTVLENVCFPLYIQRMNKQEAREKAIELLRLVGLEEKTNAYPAQLSGGQKQRVAIARALASDPKILLCDEATSALDPQTTSSILELLQDINQRFGITIVIITHQMSVVRKVCTKVAILESGVLAETGLVDEVFSHPKTKVARELIRRDIDTEAEDKLVEAETIRNGEIIRIIYSANSAYEPVIANLVLTYKEPVNILQASTKNVGGYAKGEMLIEFLPDSIQKEAMKQYLRDHGIELEEVTDHVDA